MSLIEILKILFLGLVEGVTEWLPISSTGHMLLVDEFLKFDASRSFKEMFFVVIQLGAILAVVVLFWKKMWPLRLEKGKGLRLEKDTLSIWGKVIVACIPGALAAVLLDQWVEAYLKGPVVIAMALIFYGVAFLLIEHRNKTVRPRIKTLEEITYPVALQIGLFQVLSIIPGTSRSGATIVGALLIGVSRVAAAEFTFFLAVPVMFGLSFLKLLKFGFHFSGSELWILLLGMVSAFLVSLAVIRFLMSYIRKHDFKVFGVYRIVLGCLILLYFLVIK